MDRAIQAQIFKDLNKKMVLLSGPRQVGKTWLARKIAESFAAPTYLNFDQFEQRQIIHNQSWLEETDLIIFDELHKMPKWKNYLKGVYDTKPSHLKILVTGSARLQTFRQAGDSLAGRYYLHRLLPFSLAELKNPCLKDQDQLMTQGGFPEAFLSSHNDEANRWRLQYSEGLIRDDILDFEKIHNMQALRFLLERLKRSVGSAISYQSIAEDLMISPHTVKKYIQILEELFIIFRITPYSKNITRSLLKEPKVYFYDTGMVIGDEGLRFENFVAVSLLKHLYEVQDLKGIPTTLQYLKTKNKQEVDFCLVKDSKIESILEAKLSQSQVSPHLKFFCKKYQLKGVQLVKNLTNEKQIESIQVRKSFSYLKNL